MADASVARAVCTWLSVVVKHVNVDECIAAAVEGCPGGYRWFPLAVPSEVLLTWIWHSTRRSCTHTTFVLSVVTSGLGLHLCWVTHLQH